MPKVNIVLVEIVNNNLGDAVIADTTYYLLGRALPFLSKTRYEIYRYAIDCEDYEILSHADIIVFAGGGLIKYKHEEFYLYVSRIVECANRNGIPVYFNGVGVEGYEADDEKCMMLRKALNCKCVKGIAVRDDIKTVRTKYLEQNKAIASEVVDPAIFADKVYGVKKDSYSNIIGIGIARSDIFADYGIPEVDKMTQINMLKELIFNIEKMGYKWQLFVNGLNSDYKFALEFLSYIGMDEKSTEHLALRPIESRELVSTIASYKGVVAYRMHANIIAYSLGIPSIGLVWNEKLKFFGERIGYPERFLTKEHFDGRYIAECLQKGIEEGVDKKKASFSNATFSSLKKFIHEYGKNAEAQNKVMDVEKSFWQDKMIATALGSVNIRHSGINCMAAAVKNVKDGFKYMEADVRLTTDGKLVCVNGWSPKSYKRLGVSEGKYDWNGMPYKEFMNCGYYENHYPVMDLRQLEQFSRAYPECKIILDIGIPPKSRKEEYRKAFEHFFMKYKFFGEQCMIRLQTETDVNIFRKSPFEFKLMFYYPKHEVRERDGITASTVKTVCENNEIQWISVDIGTFDKDTAEELMQINKKICVFSCRTSGEIIESAKKGADLIGTHYITVNQMNNMIGTMYN